MSNRPLILVGGGGHARSILSLAISESTQLQFLAYDNQKRKTCPIYIYAGYVDDNPNSKMPIGPYLGPIQQIENFFPEASFLLAIGHLPFLNLRKKILGQIPNWKHQIAMPVVAPTAFMGIHCHIGRGTVVFHSALLNTNVTIGEHCIINTGAIIEHDSYVGNHVHIAPGAIVNGGCQIEDDVFIGSGAILFQNIRVGKGAIIGAGSVVTHSIPPRTVWAGNPARKVKELT